MEMEDAVEQGLRLVVGDLPAVHPELHAVILKDNAQQIEGEVLTDQPALALIEYE
jgi:hypothetical protein